MLKLATTLFFTESGKIKGCCNVQPIKFLKYCKAKSCKNGFSVEIKKFIFCIKTYSIKKANTRFLYFEKVLIQAVLAYGELKIVSGADLEVSVKSLSTPMLRKEKKQKKTPIHREATFRTSY